MKREYDTKLLEFADAVKNALKTEGLWEHLQKQPGLRLPKDAHNFLRSVENIKVGRGPLNNFRLLKVLLAFLEWPSDRIFGSVIKAQTASVKDSQGEIDESIRTSYVDTVVERSLKRIEQKLEIKAIRKLIPRQKSNEERMSIYHDLVARTLVVIIFSRESERPQSFLLLFESLTKLNPHKYGHLGTSFECVDGLLALREQQEVEMDERLEVLYEWRLLLAYQLAAIKMALGPFWKLKSNEKTDLRLQIIGCEQDRIIFQKLHSFCEKLEEWLLKSGLTSTGLSQTTIKDLQIGTIELQNVLSMLDSKIRISQDMINFENLSLRDQVKLVMTAKLYPMIVNKSGLMLTLDQSWLGTMAYAFYVVGHTFEITAIPKVRDCYTGLGNEYSADTAFVELNNSRSRSPWELLNSEHPLAIVERFLKDLGYDIPIVNFEQFSAFMNNSQAGNKKQTRKPTSKSSKPRNEEMGDVSPKPQAKQENPIVTEYFMSKKREDERPISPDFEELYSDTFLDELETKTPDDFPNPEEDDFAFSDEYQTPDDYEKKGES